MPTQTNFELIFLGTVADVDIVESGDGSVAENAADLLGTYGSAGAPLSGQQFDAFTTDGNDDGLVLENGEGAAAAGDTLTVDVGGTPFVYEIDSTVGFLGTVTYADGTSESAALGIIQDNAGNLWLLPVSNAADFNINEIESISLNTVIQDNGGGFAPASSSGLEFVCFAPETLIATPGGPRAVETLGSGDLVTTLDHGPQLLLDRFTRQLDFTNGAPDSQKPIEIKAGALGPRQPARPLVVSPQHRVMITDGAREVLGPAKGLLATNAARVRKGQRQIEYHALLFANHQIILAEGCPVESLYPGPRAMALLNCAQQMKVFAKLPALMADPVEGYGPFARPVVTRRDMTCLHV